MRQGRKMRDGTPRAAKNAKRHARRWAGKARTREIRQLTVSRVLRRAFAEQKAQEAARG